MSGLVSPALLHEVTVAVDGEAADAYLAWLDAHAPEVAAAGGFTSATVYDVTDAPADGRRHVCVQYAVPSQAALDAYVSGPAAALRADAEARFGGRFAASRRVLTPRDGGAG